MPENTLHRERSRHIGVRKYYVRKLVVDKLVKLIPCGTKEMVADALTKNVEGNKLKWHLEISGQVLTMGRHKIMPSVEK